ncbi:MAG: prefoldin subunit alpha [Nanoarchaeota archaeon]|nr:prefoldin subunit alpha [Nanoarchaeota archaeon]MBU0978109.1 prefoldin subunit alpha [Nanoarchaeota archaeon]
MINVDESQELLHRAMSLREKSEEIEKQLQFVSEQISELNRFAENLDVLMKNPEKEMLAGIGRGVHMKVSRAEEEKLFVEVGAGVVVRKTPKEAKEIVESQVKKFNEAKVQLTGQLHEHAEEFRKMLQEVEGIKGE